MRRYDGHKPKDLLMIPARVAIALCDDGWYLRADIIWAKDACMPESVTDRPTRSHEHVFLLSKAPRYFYDADAIREPHTHKDAHLNTGNWAQSVKATGAADALPEAKASGRAYAASRPKNYIGHANGRNARDVWRINPRPFKGSHYAVFPPELPERCIKAGTSERGVCSVCGAPWRRVVEHKNAESGRAPKASEYSQRDARFARGGAFEGAESRTVGWEPTCSHDAEVEPAVVLDPFAGSGTTLMVARKLGRKSIGIDLDARNVKLLEERLGYQGVLL